MIDSDFLRWFAGFWEGEGWLSVRPHHIGSKHYTVGFGVRQVNKAPLNLIASKLGGKLSYEPRKNPKWNPTWAWTIRNRVGAIKITRLLLPHLKFRQAEVRKKLKVLEELEGANPTHAWVTTDRFSTKENDYVKLKWQTLTDKEIAKKLGRREDAVRIKRKELGLRKPQQGIRKMAKAEGLSGR